MAHLPQPIARVRHALRTFLTTRKSLQVLDDADLVLVACSGGADSVALASQAAFLAPRMGLRAGLVTVDHQMQPGSACQARRVGELGDRLGLDPVDVRTAQPQESGVVGVGPEGAARQIRYELLTQAASQLGARAVLLAHTMEDQAETVLLGLSQGAGTRAVAGMPQVRDIFWRPLLGVRRQDTARTCQVLDLPVWEDPTNHPQGPWRTASGGPLPRAALRHWVLPKMADALGQDPVVGLARTASLARADADYVDAEASRWFHLIRQPDAQAPQGAIVGVGVEDLEALPDALRWRVLRQVMVRSGVDPTRVVMEHVMQLDRLITDWRGQRSVSVPGGRRGLRTCGRLYIVNPTTRENT